MATVMTLQNGSCRYVHGEKQVQKEQCLAVIETRRVAGNLIHDDF